MVLGVWGNTDLAECARIIHRALDAGINLVDTADVYGVGENEEIVGRALAGRRDDVVLATKFHGAMGDDPNRRGNSRRWIDAGRRRQPAPARRRPHRPVPDPPARPGDADRRDGRRPRRPRPGRQDPLLGHVDVPGRRASSRRAGRRPGAASPGRTPSSRRTRSSAGTSSATCCRSCRRHGIGRAHVEPAVGWLAHRQVPSGGRRPGGLASSDQPRPLRRRQPRPRPPPSTRLRSVAERRRPAARPPGAGVGRRAPGGLVGAHRPAHRGAARRPARGRST